MLGENRLIFALEPNLKMDTETLVLHSGHKFMCFVVHFHKNFWFWCQTGIVPEKVYAGIWPFLEISSLNSLSLVYIASFTLFLLKKTCHTNIAKKSVKLQFGHLQDVTERLKTSYILMPPGYKLVNLKCFTYIIHSIQ